MEDLSSELKMLEERRRQGAAARARIAEQKNRLEGEAAAAEKDISAFQMKKTFVSRSSVRRRNGWSVRRIRLLYWAAASENRKMPGKSLPEAGQSGRSRSWKSRMSFPYWNVICRGMRRHRLPVRNSRRKAAVFFQSLQEEAAAATAAADRQ